MPFASAVTADGNLRVEFIGLHVNADFRVQYVSQSLTDVFGFLKRWPLRQREVQFKLENSSMTFDIRVTLNNSLTVPEEAFTEYGNLFVFETSCSMQTYVGQLHYIPVVRQIGFTSDVVQSTSPRSYHCPAV